MTESFFFWQSEGPDMRLICLLVGAIACAILLLRIFNKIKILGVLGMSGVVVFVMAMSMWAKFHPDWIAIYEDRLMGFNGLSDFDISVSDIAVIKSSVTQKTGSRGVHVFIEGVNVAKNIPMVTGDRNMEYRKSLERFCQINGIDLKWFD
jgi:hypothetical protein